MRIAVLLIALLAASAQADLRTLVTSWLDGHQKQVLDELVQLLSIPNVAADHPNIGRNAERLQQMLTARGFRAELLETAGNPLVYGDLRVPGATRTLLLYCHYDGQPVDPAQWKQPSPFTPVLRRGRLEDGAPIVDFASVTRVDPDWRLYARSASDDKAPIVAVLAAIDALKSAGRAPSSNIRIVLDGEEEASSPSLVPAIARYRDRFRADMMIILDGPTHPSGRPTVVYGARGIVTADLTVYGPVSGVHSGNYGNWIPNPAQRLAALLASMKDENGRVKVDGFYDGIAPLAAAEKAMIAAVPDDSAQVLRAFGVAAPEAAFPQLQQALQYPTLNIRGLVSAHVGSGARTIIPDRATAALDLRLVKETLPEDLVKKLRAHIEKQGFHLVDGEPDAATRAQYSRIASLKVSAPPLRAFRTPPDDPQARALVAAITAAYGAPPVELRTLGGTVPIAPFIQAVGFPAVLVPLVNFDNNQHEENENLRLGTFFDGIVTVAALLEM
ncbi:MAG TPA: M20/M25/M40 family metallo-hydrolase [Vicinamibacterales bacterium]|jgi:acetylornithine deacetylase/succinyl-diaminopimelate desuccinylase-like protein|nr:M20/M25/M40 family metallo-hydrolase [Vicinamibacterales bacterium]